MSIADFLSKLKYDIEHPKCKRCGRELYIPEAPKSLQESWGVFAWTAFVKQYAKRQGWFELENLNRNLVCPNCIQKTDTPNTIILDRFDCWIENYNKWLKDNENNKI